MPDHHNCAFGKWYYSDGMNLCGHIARFRNLENPHEKLHKLAKDAVDAFNKGDAHRARATCKELGSLSSELVNSLGLTKQEYAEGTAKKA